MSEIEAESEDVNIEVTLLLQAIYLKYCYDFRSYSRASVKRRIALAISQLDLKSITQLQERLLHDEVFFSKFLQYLTIPTTEMFRDPEYYKVLREVVVPSLKTYPSFKIWIAGCSTGQEVYSFAILLKEEGLLDRGLIYATDINSLNLEKAEQGIYPVDEMKKYSRNYQQTGARASFADYFDASSESVQMNRDLIKNVVFSDHDLATDSVFSEVQLISCRNVFIYFNRELQDRALKLFFDSLSHKGFLGLGHKESIQFSSYKSIFHPVSKPNRIYQRN